MNVGPEVDRRKSAGTDKSPKEPRLAGDVTILEAIQAPETPGRRSQLKPIPVKKRRPFSVRAESTKHLTQPVRLRNEKIKTVPDLALAVTRWQTGMNEKMEQMDEFMEATSETLEYLVHLAKKQDSGQDTPSSNRSSFAGPSDWRRSMAESEDYTWVNESVKRIVKSGE
eukprot:FR738054.1.p1 GENE.FR738054.1~~FR738054.1.p1  ORF type:complete len:177 (+),score=3.46 FR738054.1:25-531(+)